MDYVGFCGPSNPSQSLLADCERTVNLHLETIGSQGAPSQLALYPTPGQQAFTVALSDADPRASISVNGRLFTVIGGSFIELVPPGLEVVRGFVTRDARLATIHYNGVTGNQLFVCSGNNGYSYDLTTNVLTQRLFGDATMGGMLNSRFLAFNLLTGTVRMSNLNDGATWDPTLFFNRSLAPDPWQAMIVIPPGIWLIGSETGEVWYDSGASPQPFAPIPGAFFPYGTVAPWSVTKAGDYVMWLAQTQSGTGKFVAARGYSPQQISNFAVENAFADMIRTSTIADCEALVYEDRGHIFANFTCWQAQKTWTVDLSMGMAWHERGRWNAALGQFDAWGPRTHVYAFGKHLVGNRNAVALNQLDVTFGSESDGSVIRRLRIPPPLWASASQRLIISRFELMADSGLGLTSGQGSDPKVMCRYSRDGKTWGAEVTASAGKIGNYQTRMIWRRCGSSDRLWVPEVTMTDPVPIRISGAMIEGSGFQQARAA